MRRGGALRDIGWGAVQCVRREMMARARGMDGGEGDGRGSMRLPTHALSNLWIGPAKHLRAPLVRHVSVTHGMGGGGERAAGGWVDGARRGGMAAGECARNPYEMACGRDAAAHRVARADSNGHRRAPRGQAVLLLQIKGEPQMTGVRLDACYGASRHLSATWHGAGQGGSHGWGEGGARRHCLVRTASCAVGESSAMRTPPTKRTRKLAS